MPMLKRPTTTTRELRGDAAWLEGLLRQAGVPVRSREALVPVTANSRSCAAAELQLASPELRTRAEQVVWLAQAQQLPVFPLAVAPLFSWWRLYTKSPRYDYVFCNLAEDPLFSDPDGFPIPQAVLRHLHRLQEAGLSQEFEMLYVVHEVKKGTVRKGEPLTADKLVPASPKVQRASRLFGALSMGLWLGTAVPLVVGAGVGLGMASAGLILPALALDPLLMGAMVAPGRPVRAGEQAVWFYLAHWRYGEDNEPA
jgi:hypothetical protein